MSITVIHKMGVPWPPTKPRCPSQKWGRFLKDSKPVTLHQACDRLVKSIDAFTPRGTLYRTKEIVIHADIQVGAGKRFRSDSRKHRDAGVVVNFDLDGRQYTIATDRYTAPADNICAIAAYVEGLRAQERHGIADLGEMLMGHAALPGRRTWREVLGFSEGDTVSIDDVRAAYRRLAAENHPDRPGGSHDAMSVINQARDEAMAELEDK